MQGAPPRNEVTWDSAISTLQSMFPSACCAAAVTPQRARHAAGNSSNLPPRPRRLRRSHMPLCPPPAPAAYDLAVLETFLDLNRGKMETTVEQLLAMDSSAPAAGAPSAAPPPQSPIDCTVAGACGEVVVGTFVPFGATHLRMTELPWAPV